MRSTFFSLPAPVRSVLSLLLFSSFTLADVEFVSPNAGGFVPAGTIEVQWKDSGISPPISELTQYTLSLMVGGNDDADMLPLTTFVSQGNFADGDTAQGTIPDGIAGEVNNGFFFKIVSTKETGGTVINYSSRFSITGLTKTTPAQYAEAVQELNGSTDGPPAVGNDAQSSSTASSSSSDQAIPTASQTQMEQTSSSAAVITVTPTSEPTALPSTEPSSDSSSGLSSGAVAGIIAACAIMAVALLAALAMWFLRRRRQANAQVEMTGAPQNPFLDDKAELSAVEEPKPHRAWTNFTELSTESVVHEADDGQQRPELDHMNFRAELEGSTPVTPRSGV